jgi:uncharacterized protein (TIGR02246 family)
MTHPSADTDEIDDTVENLLERIKDAWNTGDAVAYAREFTDDATYVIFRGDALRGRAEIEHTHLDMLGKWQRGTRMIIHPVATTMPDDDVASVPMIGGIGEGNPIAYDKFQTVTPVRRDGRWQCAAFQNTAMSEHSKLEYSKT